MKKILLSLLALTMAVSMLAIPAKLEWRTVRQSDGTTVELMLVGDENLHYYVTRDNVPVVKMDEDNYCYACVEGGTLASTGLLAHEAHLRTFIEAQHTTDASIMRRIKAPHIAHGRKRQVGFADTALFSGTKKALVILAQFKDKSFSGGDATALSFYQDMLNKKGFDVDGAAGSVNDYFGDMSRGKFNLLFDVVGPVRVEGRAASYGGTSAFFGGFDDAGTFITDAITKADSLYGIDWTQYDWNNDGEVEQVFVLYAGYGMATGGETGTIWPHAWTLDEAYSGGCGGKGGMTIDGKYINQYACGNELYGNYGSTKMGMGVFCHEFSHCMGLPDMYDTKYGGNYGMDNWDLLDHGSYNGPHGLGECPAGWTSYERNFAGWIDYVELQPGDSISGMKSLTDGGEAYIVYNDAHKDEYFLLENRRHTSWDKYVPDEGLLAIHVDYDSLLWVNNVVNSTGDFTTSEGYTQNFTNDHPRMTMLHKLRSLSEETFYDTYPMVSSKIYNDSITDTSRPAATLYHANTDGSLLLHKPICHIAKATNGDISFSFMPGQGLRGDVNLDGTVDVSDVTTLINKILGQNPHPFHAAAADLNGDGRCDVADVTALINIILASHSQLATEKRTQVFSYFR